MGSLLPSLCQRRCLLSSPALCRSQVCFFSSSPSSSLIAPLTCEEHLGTLQEPALGLDGTM